MSDVAIIFSEEDGFDIDFTNTEFKTDNGLQTAIYISLFSNRRHDDQEGYWGDMFPEAENDKHGSILWSLKREKISKELLKRIEDAATDALKWMIEDGIAKAIAVEAVRVGTYNIRINIEITKSNNAKPKFSYLWEGVIDGIQ